MIGLLLRIYRALMNARPGPGQPWRLAGVGLVVVHEVGSGWRSGIELRRLHGGQLTGWSLANFRRQATLEDGGNSPTLADLQHHDGPSFEVSALADLAALERADREIAGFCWQLR